MGFQDYKLISAGSVLGRLWPTIGLAIRVVFIGYIFGLILNTSRGDYLPWLATGWASWFMISSSLNRGSMAFDSSKKYILAFPLSYESYIVRVMTKELLVFIQNLVVVVGVLIVYRSQLSAAVLLVIPGMAITLVFLIGFSMILGPLVSKRKDFGQLISSLVGVMFFVLPIVWRPDSIRAEGASFILGLNPLYHYLQIVRLPLLSEVPTAINYGLATLGAIVAVSIGIVVMNRVRTKLVYWI